MTTCVKVCCSSIGNCPATRLSFGRRSSLWANCPSRALSPASLTATWIGTMAAQWPQFIVLLVHRTSVLTWTSWQLQALQSRDMATVYSIPQPLRPIVPLYVTGKFCVPGGTGGWFLLGIGPGNLSTSWIWIHFATQELFLSDLRPEIFTSTSI